MECLLWRIVGDGGNFEVVSRALGGAEALSAGLSCSETMCWCFIHLELSVFRCINTSEKRKNLHLFFITKD